MDDKNQDEDLLLRALLGDDSVKADVLDQFFGQLEVAIQRRFFDMSASDVEDVVAEAIARFWDKRENFDQTRSVGAYVYRIAVNVGYEFSAKRHNWRKMRAREQLGEDNDFAVTSASTTHHNVSEEDKELHDAVREELNRLPPIERDTLRAYASSGDFELKAADLGRELGRKYKNGVPLTANHVRQLKLRGRRTVINNLKSRGFDTARLERST